MLILVGSCGLGLAVFLMLWLRAKEALGTSAKILEVNSARFRSAKLLEEKLNTQLTDALSALTTTRSTLITEREAPASTITQLQSRYLRVAQWEGVEGHREKEREVQEHVDVLERELALVCEWFSPEKCESDVSSDADSPCDCATIS